MHQLGLILYRNIDQPRAFTGLNLGSPFLVGRYLSGPNNEHIGLHGAQIKADQI